MKFYDAIQLQIDRDRAYRREKGYEFKERTVATHTIGDFISAVMAINNEADAQEFYRGYVEWLEAQPGRKTEHTAKHVADMNIGWCFGEGMTDERKQMWAKCTTASHPIFGANNVPLKSTHSVKATLGDEKDVEVYMLDLSALTLKPRAALLTAVAEKFGVPVYEVEAEIEKTGFPIRAVDVIVSYDARAFA